MSHLTFADAIDLHRTHLRAKRRAAATLRWYDYQLDHFVSWRQANTLPDVLPHADEIEPSLVDRVRASISRTGAQSMAIEQTAELGDDVDTPRWIATVRGVGYKFVAPTS